MCGCASTHICSPGWGLGWVSGLPPADVLRTSGVLSQHPAPPPFVSRSPDASLTPRLPVPGSAAHTSASARFPCLGQNKAQPFILRQHLPVNDSSLFPPLLLSSPNPYRLPNAGHCGLMSIICFHLLGSLARREGETEAQGGLRACPGSQR